jgi:hypothetical protein
MLEFHTFRTAVSLLRGAKNAVQERPPGRSTDPPLHPFNFDQIDTLKDLQKDRLKKTP